MSKSLRLILSITGLLVTSLLIVSLFANSYFNQPVETAKKDIVKLKPALEIVQELKVEFYANRELTEPQYMCQSIKYSRGYFVDDEYCYSNLDTFIPGLDATPFDNRTRADYNRLRSQLESTGVMNISLSTEKDNPGIFFAKDFNTTASSWPLMTPKEYFYLSDNDKNLGQYPKIHKDKFTQLENNWYYIGETIAVT